MIKIANAQFWVHDHDAALGFYTRKLGWEVRADTTIEGWNFRWLVVGPPGQDEIGLVQTEISRMQRALRAALAHKTRLAALGTAVSKINHDLRNILASAMVVSDRLDQSQDPEVRHVTPRLLEALDRAARLCSATLNFTRVEATDPRKTRFALAPLIDEVGEAPEARDVHVELGVERAGHELRDLHAGRERRVLDGGRHDRVDAGLGLGGLDRGAERVERDCRGDQPGGRVLLAHPAAEGLVDGRDRRVGGHGGEA